MEKKAAYEVPKVDVIELKGDIAADVLFPSGWNTDGDHQGDVCTNFSGFCEMEWGTNTYPLGLRFCG